jgi:hypothetical protein
MAVKETTNSSPDAASIEVEKADVHQYERAVGDNSPITPQEIQARYDLLRDLNTEQMAALNKKVLSKLDWRLMPTITIMFLMK